MKQRVAITGIGAITPIGTGVDELWSGVRCGRSTIRTIDRFDPAQTASKVAGQIEFDPLQHMSPKRARRWATWSSVSPSRVRVSSSSSVASTVAACHATDVLIVRVSL